MHRLIPILLLTFCSLTSAEPVDLKKVGEAELRVLFWSIYNSTLYSADGQYSEGQRPLQLKIQYLLDIDSEALVERTGEEWSSQGMNHERQQQWLDALATLWPDVSKNDVLTLDIDEQDRSTFYRNGELLGVIEDPEFGDSFTGIWLSPTTTRPKLRLALTGQQN
ncbi:MAG: chalcone isomerase family protein [Halieaceae bacterium]